MEDKEILYNILMNIDIIESVCNNVDILVTMIPEINSMIGFEHKNPHHHLDVWNHTILALSLSDADFEVRLSLLLHDIGKPICCQEGEIRHFKGHSIASSEIARSALTRIGYDNDFIERICYLVRNHDNPIKKSEINVNNELEYKRFLIQTCDAFAHNPLKLEKRIEYLEKTKKLLNV